MTDSYNYILRCIEKRAIPKEEKISLGSYCEFYGKEIEHHIIEIKLSDNNQRDIQILDYVFQMIIKTNKDMTV